MQIIYDHFPNGKPLGETPHPLSHGIFFPDIKMLSFSDLFENMPAIASHSRMEGHKKNTEDQKMLSWFINLGDF